MHLVDTSSSNNSNNNSSNNDGSHNHTHNNSNSIIMYDIPCQHHHLTKTKCRLLLHLADNQGIRLMAAVKFHLLCHLAQGRIHRLLKAANTIRLRYAHNRGLPRLQHLLLILHSVQRHRISFNSILNNSRSTHILHKQHIHRKRHIHRNLHIRRKVHIRHSLPINRHINHSRKCHSRKFHSHTWNSHQPQHHHIHHMHRHHYLLSHSHSRIQDMISHQ